MLRLHRAGVGKSGRDYRGRSYSDCLVAIPDNCFANLMDSILPISLEAVESRKFGGFMLSITIGVVAIACSLPIGIVLALGRQSDLMIVKALCVALSSSSAVCR